MTYSTNYCYGSLSFAHSGLGMQLIPEENRISTHIPYWTSVSPSAHLTVKSVVHVTIGKNWLLSRWEMRLSWRGCCLLQKKTRLMKEWIMRSKDLYKMLLLLNLNYSVPLYSGNHLLQYSWRMLPSEKQPILEASSLHEGKYVSFSHMTYIVLHWIQWRSLKWSVPFSNPARFYL